MRYVILRDDDTNPLTPPEYLERLYRPFLERQMPVNLAVIPEVRTTVTTPEGQTEGFLCTKGGETRELLRIDSNPGLLSYLFKNPGYHFAQHGLHHDHFEFDMLDRAEAQRRFDRGAQLFMEAGFPKPTTFVAPHDKFSRVSMAEAARRFRVISSGWFERERLPWHWLPKYSVKRLTGKPHWRMHRTALLTHPGCLLSCYRCYETMLDEVKTAVESQQLTVLVTHWWEYFRNGRPDEDFIDILHQVAAWLGSREDIEVISFDDLAAHPGRYMSESPAQFRGRPEEAPALA